MDTLIENTSAWIIALVFAAAMFACWTAGWRRGQRMPPEPSDDPGVKFTDASVGLLGLLLAFTFSMALGRHDYRRLAVIAESNAIGDFYTCATLLKEPHRSELQTAIGDYAKRLLETPYESLTGDEQQRADQRDFAAFSRMTAIVSKALEGGTPIGINLTNTLNNLTSSNASRLAAFQERLPWSIVLLLFLSSLAPSFLIGLKQGSSKLVHPSGSFSFIVLVTLVIFVTLDLNQPRRGTITVGHTSLGRVLQSMGK
jgi:hypothetical protein